MQKFQVSFIGLSTLFGRTSSLLLKQSPFIKCIKLYDEHNIDPALDVAGLNTQCKVKAFLGKEQLKTALKDAHIIVIGEEASSENMNIADPFAYSAPKILDYANAIASAAPEAIVVVAASPVNCLLPLITQMLVHHGCFNCNKVLGATTVDNIRANSLLAAHLKADARQVVLPVIGGSSEETRVPIFSQARPNSFLPTDIKEKIIKGIKKGEVEVRKKKKCPESLNKAYATSRFVNTIMAGLRGEPNVTDIALTKTTAVPGIDYFALPVMLGRHGVTQRFGIPTLTSMEQNLVNKAISSMKKDIDKAGIYWRRVATQPFPVLNQQVSPAFDLSSDLTNVDTKPKNMLLPYSSSGQDEKYPKDILEKRAKRAKPAMVNPIDRLFQMKTQDEKEDTAPYPEFRLMNKTAVSEQWQIPNYSEVQDKTENVGKNAGEKKDEPDLQKENHFLVKPNAQANSDNAKSEKPVIKKSTSTNVLSTLIKKTEQIIAQNKQAMENPPKGKKENPEEIEEVKKKPLKQKPVVQVKIENVLKASEPNVENNRKEIDNKTDLKKISEILEKNKPKISLGSKTTEKLAKPKPFSFAIEDHEKEKFTSKKQEKLIEQAKRETLMAMKLQRIAEKRASNVQKSVLFTRKDNQKRKPTVSPTKINTNYPLMKGKVPETSVVKPSKVESMSTENVKKPIKQETKEIKKEARMEQVKSYDLAEIEQPLKAYIGEPFKGKALFCKTTVIEEKNPNDLKDEGAKESKNSLKTPSKLSQSESKKELKDDATKLVPKQIKKHKLKVHVKGVNSKAAPKLLYPPKLAKTAELVKFVPVEKASIESKGVKNLLQKQMKVNLQTTLAEENATKQDLTSKSADNKTEVDMKYRERKVEEKKQQAESKVPNVKEELKRKDDKNMTLLQILTAHAEKSSKVKEVRVEEVKKELKKEVTKEVKKEAKKEEPPKMEDIPAEMSQEDKKSGSFKNLLQMLPATRKNFLKPKDKVKLLEEAKKLAELKEQELKAMAEVPKKVIVINPVNKSIKNEKAESCAEANSQNEKSRSPRNSNMKPKFATIDEEVSTTEDNEKTESEIRENEAKVQRLNFVPSESGQQNNEIFKKQGKATTPLQLIQSQQLEKSKKNKKTKNFSENTVSDRLHRTLKSFFRRRTAAQKHNEKNTLVLKKELLKNKQLLYKFNAMKTPKIKPIKNTIASKTMLITESAGRNPYKNVVLTRKSDEILDTKLSKYLTLFPNCYHTLKYEDKEFSKSFKQALKEKLRVPVTVPLADPSKQKCITKPKRKKQKTLLHMLTQEKRPDKVTMSLRKIKLPKDIFVTKKKEAFVKIPRTLHTGTCADMVKTIGKSVPTEEKPYVPTASGTTVEQAGYSPPVKEIDALPNFSLNEYNCKSNFLPNLKFMRDPR